MSKIFILNGHQPYPFAAGALNAKFFGMTPLPSFGAFDVMKNPDIENDLKRFDTHLKSVFAPEAHHAAA